MAVAVAADLPKEARYQSVHAVLDDFLEHYPVGTVGRMATICSVIKQWFPELVFVGFYCKNEAGKLEIGPYQGAIMACGLIEMGKGVCGTAAVNKATEIVNDVTTYPNYIACDEDTKSEIVVPVLQNGETASVLDIDAPTANYWTQIDQEQLELITTKVYA